MFNPPRRLLELIEHEKQIVEMTLPTHNINSKDVEFYDSVVMLILSAMKTSFNRDFIAESTRETQTIGMAFYEALFNAIEHGNKNNPEKKIFVGFWLGKKGVLFGFRDEGDFFGQESTKGLIESRTILPSTKEDPSGCGMGYIYDADEVYVSTNENTLYFAFTTFCTLRIPHQDKKEERMCTSSESAN